MHGLALITKARWGGRGIARPPPLSPPRLERTKALRAVVAGLDLVCASPSLSVCVCVCACVCLSVSSLRERSTRTSATTEDVNGLGLVCASRLVCGFQKKKRQGSPRQEVWQASGWYWSGPEPGAGRMHRAWSWHRAWRWHGPSRKIKVWRWHRVWRYEAQGLALSAVRRVGSTRLASDRSQGGCPSDLPPLGPRRSASGTHASPEGTACRELGVGYRSRRWVSYGLVLNPFSVQA